MNGKKLSGTYRIHQVISNNFVAILEEGQEEILRGLGIGFKKQPGDLVPAARVEKVYALRDPEKSSRLMQLLSDVPSEFLDISTAIIELAEKTLGCRLSENIYITLTDHICFAVERCKMALHIRIICFGRFTIFIRESLHWVKKRWI